MGITMKKKQGTKGSGQRGGKIGKKEKGAVSMAKGSMGFDFDMTDASEIDMNDLDANQKDGTKKISEEATKTIDKS